MQGRGKILCKYKTQIFFLLFGGWMAFTVFDIYRIPHSSVSQPKYFSNGDQHDTGHYYVNRKIFGRQRKDTTTNNDNENDTVGTTSLPSSANQWTSSSNVANNKGLSSNIANQKSPSSDTANQKILISDIADHKSPTSNIADYNGPSSDTANPKSLSSVSNNGQANNTQYNGEMDEESILEWTSRQMTRLERVARVCRGRERDLDTEERLPLNRFMFDPPHRLLYCRHAKVGTTSWLLQFLSISNITLAEKESIASGGSPVIHARVPKLFSVEDSNLSDKKLRELAKSSFSFTVVRHPFERLVSAYQDKINKTDDTSYKAARSAIRRRFGGVTFANFARWLVERGSRECRTPSHCNLDYHWRPFVARCFYCQVPYQILIKTETLAEDTRHLSRLAQVNFSDIQTHTSPKSSSVLAKQYFAELPSELYRNIKKLYELDFEMFGYNPDDYENGKD